MKVYCAEFCPCTHESAFEVIGVFALRKDAEAEVKRHRINHLIFYKRSRRREWELWRVMPREVVTPTGATINKEGEDGAT